MWSIFQSVINLITALDNDAGPGPDPTGTWNSNDLRANPQLEKQPELKKVFINESAGGFPQAGAEDTG